MSGCTCMIDGSGGEYFEGKLQHIEIRTARKQHQCCECGKPISPGDKYEYVVYLFDGRWDADRTCSICKEIRDCYCCSWLRGGVWDTMREYFEWEEWKICTLDKLSPQARSVMVKFLDDIMEDDDE